MTSTALNTTRNWWKYAFFALLLVFEITRELLVVQMNSKAYPIRSVQITEIGGYIFAQGSWARTDGGGALVPSATAIECSRLRAECIETGLHINGNFIEGPDLAVRAAEFTESSVSFTNDTPLCVRYITHINVGMHIATQVREKKTGVDDVACAAIVDERMEMHLVNGVEVQSDVFEGTFIPIIGGLRAIF